MAFDSGMAKMLIFCFVFIGAFALMLPLIPGEFAVSTKEYDEASDTVPDTWYGRSLIRYNFTGGWIETLDDFEVGLDNSTGGRNLRLAWDEVLYPTGHIVNLFHRYGFNLWWTEAMDWYNRAGELVSFSYGGVATLHETAIDADYVDYGTNSTEFDVVCLGLGSGSSYFWVKVLFAFNTTEYALPSEAWDNAALDILVGITAENANTAIDAWQLITSLLTFNTVEVFGSSGPEILALNAIIVLPIYAAIIIPAAVFTLEALDRILPL